MSNWGAGPADAGTVQIRVQVVDVDPAALDMIVPTYIAAKDLSQRIARDANLGAYWPDGTRRDFWIRARGRILNEEEKLDDLGVVNGELLHILPQPPANSGVIERPPELPPKNSQSLLRNIRMVRTVIMLFGFALAWAIGLSVGPTLLTVFIPALAAGILSTTLSRHFFGPPGSSMRIPALGAGLYVFVLVAAFLPALISADSLVYPLIMAVLGVFAGLVGVVMGWLAWYGAVEPLPEARIEKMTQQLQEVREAPCGLCQQPVDLSDPSVRLDCVFGCGQVFHSGCYKARQAVSREGTCAACGYNPEGEPAAV